MKTGKTIHTFTALDGKEVILRTPRWEDLDDLLEFINSLVEEGAEIAMNKKMSREQEMEWLGGTLANLESNKSFHLVAEVDGKVIANSEITKHTGYSSHVCVLGIAISDGFRDIGIGTQMMKCLISKANEWSLKLIELSVYASNERAIHVYKKVGFKEIGRKPKFIFKDGNYVDQVDMILEL